jgi:hypothetical protein
MNSCQNERNIKMRYYPIVEIEMVLIQPEYITLVAVKAGLSFLIFAGLNISTF